MPRKPLQPEELEFYAEDLCFHTMKGKRLRTWFAYRKFGKADLKRISATARAMMRVAVLNG